MAKRTRGGTNQFLGKRVVKFYTNGKRADNAYGLSEQVGFIVKRAGRLLCRFRGKRSRWLAS